MESERQGVVHATAIVGGRCTLDRGHIPRWRRRGVWGEMGEGVAIALGFLRGGWRLLGLLGTPTALMGHALKEGMGLQWGHSRSGTTRLPAAANALACIRRIRTHLYVMSPPVYDSS